MCPPSSLPLPLPRVIPISHVRVTWCAGSLDFFALPSNVRRDKWPSNRFPSGNSIATALSGASRERKRQFATLITNNERFCISIFLLIIYSVPRAISGKRRPRDAIGRLTALASSIDRLQSADHLPIIYRGGAREEGRFLDTNACRANVPPCRPLLSPAFLSRVTRSNPTIRGIYSAEYVQRRAIASS